MVRPCVRRVATEDIGQLVTRLERHGAQTAKMRCFLLLIQSGVNAFKHWIYACEEEPGQPLVALVITLPTPDLLVVDAFAEDDPASHECLRSALLSPAVSARLWESGLTLRADCWPNHLQLALEGAASQRGFSVTPISAGAHMFVKEVGPDDAKTRPELSAAAGGATRPLSVTQLTRVKQHWPYLRYVPDAEEMMLRAVETGLCAGVFLPSSDDTTDSGDSASPKDSGDSGDSEDSVDSMESGVDSAQPVSWILMNLCGLLGYAHTLMEHRRRGFARLALAELTRRCARRQLPVAIATGLDNHGMVAAIRSLEFTAVHGVFWATVTPPPPPPQPTQIGTPVRNTAGT